MSKPNQRILILSGEISAEKYGASLSTEIKKLFPNTILYGVGGPALKNTVDNFLENIATQHAIGISETIKKHFFFSGFLSRLESFLINNPIDKAIISRWGR